jgi:hypothetical protein
VERPKGLACTFKETEEPKGSILPFCHFEKSVPKDATNQHMNCTNREAKGQSLPQKKPLGRHGPFIGRGDHRQRGAGDTFVKGTGEEAELQLLQS